MYAIESQVAVKLLENDPYRYSDIIELLGGRNPGISVWATDNTPPSLLLINRMEREYADTKYDVHLYVVRVEDLLDLVERLPDDGKSYLFMYDDELPPLLSGMLPLKLDASRHQFVAMPGSYPRSDEVIELQTEHDYLVMASESPVVLKNWSFCKDFGPEGFNAYGIVKDDKLLSFCSVSPSYSSSSGALVREISFIYTEEAFRQQGLGKKLLSSVTDTLTSQGVMLYYSVVSTNTASLQTARSVGLAECGHQHAYYMVD